MDIDGNVEVNIDTHNGDAIDDIKWDDNENTVEVDIDTETDSGDAIDDIQDEDEIIDQISTFHSI